MEMKEFYSTDGIPEEMKQALSFMRQWLNEDRKATPMVTARDLWHWLEKTHHQELQKARIEVLNDVLHNIHHCADDLNDVRVQTTSYLKKLQSELDQLTRNN